MKDGYMIFVILAVLFTPFLPLVLKSKCPLCGKRKLEKLGTEIVKGEDASKVYVTRYRCHACMKHFEQEKTGKLKEASPPEALESA
ncbi:hypothetical protein KA183_11380 [bacterium]|nr:hypothetical protein [bacterium]QQR59242.1 MAG: hypothetical protein IPG59_07060 [Candidatus Melainabacteria bacterium]